MHRLTGMLLLGLCVATAGCHTPTVGPKGSVNESSFTTSLGASSAAGPIESAFSELGFRLVGRYAPGVLDELVNINEKSDELHALIRAETAEHGKISVVCKFQQEGVTGITVTSDLPETQHAYVVSRIKEAVADSERRFAH